MWKIFINKNLFLILYIISYSLCDYQINLDGETCNDSPYEPPYEEACTSYHTEEKACCFATILKSDRTKVNRCIPIPKDARFALNHLTIFSFKDKRDNEYKDVTATFTCGQKDNLCGMDSPKKIFQCSEHSSTTQSCCFLTTPTYTECILSDQKYDKETTFTLFDTSTIVCNSDNLKIKKFYLIIYIILIMTYIISMPF